MKTKMVISFFLVSIGFAAHAELSGKIATCLTKDNGIVTTVEVFQGQYGTDKKINFYLSVKQDGTGVHDTSLLGPVRSASPAREAKELTIANSQQGASDDFQAVLVRGQNTDAKISVGWGILDMKCDVDWY